MPRARKHADRPVDTTGADQGALLALAAHAVPRETLQTQGYLSILSWADLHPHGYTVRAWLCLADSDLVLEYRPRLSDLPRLTVRTYAEQSAVHRALGVNVVPPGQQWTEWAPGQRGLFDTL